jgi:hypothetical protein
MDILDNKVKPSAQYIIKIIMGIEATSVIKTGSYPRDIIGKINITITRTANPSETIYVAAFLPQILKSKIIDSKDNAKIIAVI